jgi:cell wall-associated NlpC family hydrolase
MVQWKKRALGAAVGVVACMGATVVVPAASGAAPVAHRAQASGPGATTPFWLATASGRVYSFGVPDYGSPAGPLNRPVVAITPTPDHHGYWLAASDGGIFSSGDAHFYGSTGALTLNRPIVGMTPTPDGAGYWLVASDGGIFTFGDAHYYGSTGALTLGDPVERVVSTPTGQGYWVVEQNGTAMPFGNAVGASPPATGLLFTPVTPGDRAVLFAFQQLGKPYIWGGNGPVGYDCSGLALASWVHGAGVTFARVADDQYHTAGVAVPLADLQTGDLVFWGYSQTDWTSVYHTALYVGGNRIVEATGDHVQLNTLDQWSSSDVMPNGRRP